MKTLTQLQAVLTEAPPPQGAPVTQTIMEMPARGFVRHVCLGPHGVTVSCGPNVAVFIPLAEITRVAGQFEPRLLPPVPVAPAAAPAPSAPLAAPKP